MIIGVSKETFAANGTLMYYEEKKKNILDLIAAMKQN